MVYEVMNVKSWWCSYLPLTYKEFNWQEIDVYEHFLRFLM